MSARGQDIHLTIGKSRKVSQDFDSQQLSYVSRDQEVSQNHHF